MLCSLESLLTTLFIMFLQRCNSLTGFLYCPLVGPQRLSRYCSASYLRRSKAKITKINVLNAYRLCHTHDTILHADTDEYREATSSITSTSSLYEDDTSYLDHLKSDNKISKYWMQRLMQLPQGTARNLVSQLVPRNEVGYEATTGAAKKGSLVEFYIDQKIEHPDKVILMRNGEFYETFGIDALMLIAYCGLNPMGGKPKAGCPIQNVQATLDGLTNQGFSAAVYEESPESESSSGVKSKIKTRGLSQIVFPGAKMYTHDLSMRPDNIDFPENHPVVGIMKTVDGYTIVQIYLDEQTMDISQRLTLETVRVLAEGRFVQPIYLEGSCKKDVLGSHVDSVTITGCTEDDFPDQVLRNFAKAVPGTNIDDFKKRRKSYMNGPRPVYISTSLQIGLIPNPNVPPLIPFLLPKRHSPLSSEFLSKWVSHPPSHALADHMRALCTLLQSKTVPQCKSLQIKKVVSLLSVAEGNLALFKDIEINALGVRDMIESALSKGNGTFTDRDLSELLPHLTAITSSETGLETNPEDLLASCKAVLDKMREVISSAEDAASDTSSEDHYERIPNDFFIKHEESFRGKLSKKCPAVNILYEDLRVAAEGLMTAVQKDFPKDAEIKHDILNNLICFSRKLTSNKKGKNADPTTDTDSESYYGDKNIEYIHPMDRKSRPLNTKFTTEKVNAALANYLDVSEKCLVDMEQVIKSLSKDLYKNVSGIKQAAAWSVILQAALEHTVSSCQKNWCIPELVSFATHDTTDEISDQKVGMKVTGITPYWIDRYTATENDFDLHGLFLLTAPNMSGKSTLMRSILVAALLANCGFFVPCRTAQIPRYDNFFLRTSSHDVPSEGKSAFALEMQDMQIVLLDSTHKSLIMIDELGKGTSSRDGAALAGALLETLDKKKVTGIFATHLHELHLLSLDIPNTKNRRMGYTADDSGRLKWTYKLEDGSCTNSHALETAHRYGIDIDVINRAQKLGTEFDQIYKPVRRKDSSSRSNSAVADIEVDSELESDSDSDSDGADPTGSSVTESTPTPTPSLVYSPRLPSKGSASSYRPEDVGSIFEEHINDNVLTSRTAVVMPGDHPPPEFEGYSCLYVLILQRATQPDTLYVGETNRLAERLHEHRTRFKGDIVTAYVAGVSNKSFALRHETLIQKLFKKKGYTLEADADSKRTHHNWDQSERSERDFIA